MKSPEEIEKALQRLVPPALSERAHANVSSMLTSLAASSSVADAPVSPRRVSLRLPIAIAAAMAIASVSIATWTLPGRSAQKSMASSKQSSQLASTDAETAPILIDRMLVTDGMTVEGTLTAADGSVMNQINRRVQTRERYRDAKKGYLITISETRDEKVYLPKKGF